MAVEEQPSNRTELVFCSDTARDNGCKNLAAIRRLARCPATILPTVEPVGFVDVFKFLVQRHRRHEVHSDLSP